jgi:PIN domain nuclease of toxin-antitoxin system
MTAVLLDTHAFLWALLEPRKLSVAVRDLLRNPETVVRVSSATAWEISLKHRLGKLPGAAAVVSGYASHLRRFRAEELVIASTHALLAGSYPQAHRDPFDRILAAQAALEMIPLVTNDRAFEDFPVTTIW